MSPYAKAVLSVIRLIAFGCVILSVSLYASDLYLYLSQRPIAGPVRLTLKGLPILAGLALYWKGKEMAEYLTRDLE
jgi:hypothetical protein